jgi:hypothetical protein
MPKSNKPAPASPDDNPKSLDDQARSLNGRIDDGEMKTSRLMWELGDVLERRKAENPDWNWDKWLSHADSLGICKTRFTRALRIRRRFETVKDVEGRSLLDALGYKRHPDEPEPQQPEGGKALPVKARISRRESKAAEVFVKRVGNPMRALSVLVRYQTGETPEEDHKKNEKDTKAKAKQMLKAGEALDAVRKVVGNGDNESHEKAVEVLTALKDGAGDVLGTDDEKSRAYVGDVLKGMKKDEGVLAGEPTEPKSHGETGEKKPASWALGKVFRAVPHKMRNGKKTLDVLTTAHPK